MEWLSITHRLIEYLEKHIREEDCAAEGMRMFYLSPMLLQRGFQIMTGYTVAGYVRNRRLYLAALELQNTDRKVIDIALDYGFETPESFTKACTRFHGANPTQIRKGAAIRPFLPLRISVMVQGGDLMECRIEKKEAFSVAGSLRTFTPDDSGEGIPLFWDAVIGQLTRMPTYGICIDDMPQDPHGSFHYMIADPIPAGGVPEGVTEFTIPETEWAVFRTDGEIPYAVQELSRRIWNEWVPMNADFEPFGNLEIERYGDGVEIWIPVRRRPD